MGRKGLVVAGEQGSKRATRHATKGHCSQERHWGKQKLTVTTGYRDPNTRHRRRRKEVRGYTLNRVEKTDPGYRGLRQLLGNDDAVVNKKSSRVYVVEVADILPGGLKATVTKENSRQESR